MQKDKRKWEEETYKEGFSHAVTETNLPQAHWSFAVPHRKLKQIVDMQAFWDEIKSGVIHSPETLHQSLIALICRCVIRNCVRSRATSRYDILHSKHSAGMESSENFWNIKLLENDVLLLDGIWITCVDNNNNNNIHLFQTHNTCMYNMSIWY